MAAPSLLVASLLGLAIVPVSVAGSQADRQLDAWRRAALAGNADAALKLGRAYKLGDLAPLDSQEAERWFARAARGGSSKGEAEYGLVLFQNGKGREAVPWLRKAAERGDPRAQYAYATILFNGVLAPRDVLRARRLMKQAADAGLSVAAEALAVMSKPLPEEPVQPRSAEPVRQEVARPAFPAPRPVAKGASAWRVQVGAFAVRANAHRLWTRLKPLGDPTLAPRFISDGRLTRVEIGAFGDVAAAAAYCRKLKGAGFACMVLRD